MGQTVSIRLDDETIKQLDMMAKVADRSRSWLMSQAVKQYVAHEAWQIDAIRKSLEKLERGNSKFAGHEDVAQWLSTWGTEEEVECPKCG